MHIIYLNILKNIPKKKEGGSGVHIMANKSYDFGRCAYVRMNSLEVFLATMMEEISMVINYLNREVAVYAQEQLDHDRRSRKTQIENAQMSDEERHLNTEKEKTLVVKKSKANMIGYSTQYAMNYLNKMFRVGILKRTLPSRVIVVAHEDEYYVNGYDYPVYTASTDGKTIQIASSFVLSVQFNMEDNHYGPNPIYFTHYTFLMLHEYGHVLFRAIEKLPIGYRDMAILEFLGNNRGFMRCWKAMERKSNSYLSEWFADVFARTCIQSIYPELYRRQQ